ncbi:hypothetical protein [Caulobacter sp. SSI4214]|uniref:hypothetical protein n=1 Tax=Caulobacter sp. SSI4214 TaxID=2575739 RepID=UPI00143B9981|nr:hypothetical protein [Caulobacter sp. SSI4214]
MRTWRLSLMALALVATAACHDKGAKPTAKAPAAAKVAPPPAPPAPPPTELVSLTWRPADSNQNLQSFELQLTGADVVSVCHTPPGWVLKSSRAGSGVADVRGYATVGAGYISVDDLADLDGLLLIRPHPGEPIGVRGKLLTGVYADDGGQTEVTATPALLAREPAEQCPAPKA